MNTGVVRQIVGWFGMSALLVVLVIPAYGDKAPEGKHGNHMKVNGVVAQIKSGLLFVKTPWGQVTIRSSEQLKDIEVGEEVDMWVNANNVVIDVHRKGDAHFSHRYLTGQLAYASKDRSAITLWTPDGEQEFTVERGRSRLSVIAEGDPITVELNEAGKVIDVYRMAVELTLEDTPTTQPGHHITLKGTVAEIQSGVVYVKTPAARYTISAKTAPSDIQVGDELTLWVNQNNTVIDHHRKGHKSAHRLITGKLIYTGRMKNEIKLWTPEGEQVFPLDRLEIKTKPIEEGTMVTVELNEDGTVIALRKAEG